MGETLVTKGEHGLAFSKALLAQSLTATGVALENAYELARDVEQRLAAVDRIETAELRALVEELLREAEGDGAVLRYRDSQLLHGRERPVVVLLTGAPGVGKSTLATLLAHRLGITRVIATDAIRHVIRAFFSPAFMPTVHHSSFEAGELIDAGEVGGNDRDIVGYTRQASTVATGVAAIVERACQEQSPMVLEGVHLLPGLLGDDLRRRCVAVEAVISVPDPDLHRSHFHMRPGARAATRYLKRFDQIRKLHDHLIARADASGVPVIANDDLDRAVAEAMGLVLDAVVGIGVDPA